MTPRSICYHPSQQFVSDAALESVIKAVRQALGDNGRDQRLIQTVYGQGYRCVAAVTAGAPASPASVSVRTPLLVGLSPVTSIAIGASAGA